MGGSCHASQRGTALLCAHQLEAEASGLTRRGPRVNLAAHAELMNTLREGPAMLVEDGPIVPDRYSRADPRIMWVLREVNGTDERWSYADFLATDTALFSYNRWKQSLGLMAKCSTGILRGCEAWGDWAEDPSKLTESLRDIAVININKAGGGSR